MEKDENSADRTNSIKTITITDPSIINFLLFQWTETALLSRGTIRFARLSDLARLGYAASEKLSNFTRANYRLGKVRLSIFRQLDLGRKTLSLGTKIFCVLVIAVGVSEIADHGITTWQGMTLAQSDRADEVRIVDKQIERPGPMRKPRTESITVNGTKIRGFHTYFNQYVLTVAYNSPSGPVTFKAPVSYDRWHIETVGTTVSAVMDSDIAEYADVDENGTLFYGLRQLAMGLLIVVVGFIALRFADDMDA